MVTPYCPGQNRKNHREHNQDTSSQEILTPTDWSAVIKIDPLLADEEQSGQEGQQKCNCPLKEPMSPIRKRTHCGVDSFVLFVLFGTHAITRASPRQLRTTIDSVQVARRHACLNS